MLLSCENCDGHMKSNCYWATCSLFDMLMLLAVLLVRNATLHLFHCHFRIMKLVCACAWQHSKLINDFYYKHKQTYNTTASTSQTSIPIIAHRDRCMVLYTKAPYSKQHHSILHPPPSPPPSPPLQIPSTTSSLYTQQHRSFWRPKIKLAFPWNGTLPKPDQRSMCYSASCCINMLTAYIRTAQYICIVATNNNLFYILSWWFIHPQTCTNFDETVR